MRKLWMTAITTALTVALGGLAFAAAKAKAPASHSAVGTIESYDATAKTLTLKTTKGSSTFTLAATAKVWEGTKSVSTDQLSSEVGAKATVKYTESGGAKTATNVRVTPAAKPATQK